MTRHSARLSALILPLCLAALPGWAQDAAEAAPGTEAAQAESAAQNEDVTVTHALSVFGTPALPADFQQLPYVNVDAPKGGEISIAASGGYDSFNPYTVKGRPAALSSVMNERIMQVVHDEVETMYCVICETVEFPESRDWAIFNLRSEAQFSDGTPLTADDVLFTYETLRDKGLSSFRTVIAQSIAGAEVLDDHRIRFDFVDGYPRRDVIQGAGNLPVFSKADFEAKGRDLSDSSDEPFIGSGPYMYGGGAMGRSVTWQRNPDYWGKDLPINKGRYNFDRITIQYFGDSDTAFEGFSAGEYTLRRESSADKWATSYNFDAVRDGYVVKAELPSEDKASAQGFFFNMRREKFQDVRVRKAIGIMFNFEWANTTLFHEQYTRTESFWENSYLKAEGKPSEGELALLEPLAADLPEGVLTDDAVTPVAGGERQLNRRDLRAAAALLDEAGWTVGDDGKRRNADGELLTVEFMEDNPTFHRIINPFIENLRALGIDATLAAVDDAEYQNRRYEFDYDIVVAVSLTDMVADDGLYQMFGSQGADDVFNAAGLSNPAIDSLIASAVAAETEEEMITATHALDRALRALHIWVPNWYKQEKTIAYYDQYAYPDPLPPYLDADLYFPFYFDFWWYDEAKAQRLRDAGVLR
ncbi:extracellular solute-binding protein [Paracoccus aerodenitrificans]|uniref:extracellular solute-binding protein n=1 Tax=Paracoccus aerodenitrificans TaxID=3017781 RepID=UPI0022F13B20|nr:extracellular solute-binding protein [Paracoccus aerodenitrificans]WBU65223.1 extracellular solute-binding protein [Paracoccus aerodenitrificans]